MARRLTSATISEGNKYSDWVKINGTFSLSLSGTWDATVWVQRSFDGGTTPHDVKSFTANVQMTGYSGEEALYRFGVKTSEYTSGDVIGRIAQ
jgi:hypothetical protein